MKFKASANLSWRSLTWQLILLTILPLTVLVLAVAFGSLAVHQKAMRTLVGERDERAVRTAAAALEEQISHRSFAIRNLALLSEGANTEKLASILASTNYLLPEFEGGMAFLRPDGNLEIANDEPAIWEDLASQIKPMLDHQLGESNTQFITGVFTPTRSTEPVVVILAVSPDGAWAAVGSFSVTALVRHTLSDTFASGSGASLTIVDGEKNLIYTSGSISGKIEMSRHPGISQALHGESGTLYVWIGKDEYVVAYSPIPIVGWGLVYEEPWAMVESPVLRTSLLAPLVLVPVLILAVVALWFGARQIVKPLQTLESRAASLAQGDFKAIEIPVGGIEEIRQLQTEMIRMASKVQAAQKSLHGYIGAITTAQEEERRRLARELHDDTIQSLIALKQRVQLVQLAAENGSAEESLKEVVSLTEQTIENVRRQTRALRPIYLEELGLVTALEMLARETSLAANIPVEFQRLGKEIRLSANVELALYRMAQESLNNVGRHSQASQAFLNISFTPQQAVLTVRDNGKGFEVPLSPSEFASRGHFGLLGLYERAELIGATLEIQSIIDKGTTLRVTLSGPHTTQ